MFKVLGKRETAEMAIDTIRAEYAIKELGKPRHERMKAAIITIKDTKTGEVFKFPFKELEKVPHEVIKHWDFIPESTAIMGIMYTPLLQGFLGHEFERIKKGQG